MKYDVTLQIGGREISQHAPTYFIADIAANHDGDLARAQDLIWKAKEAGADCAKFQHFLADKIVSDVGFSRGVGQVSHQAGWTSRLPRFMSNITRDENGPTRLCKLVSRQALIS